MKRFILGLIFLSAINVYAANNATGPAVDAMRSVRWSGQYVETASVSVSTSASTTIVSNVPFSCNVDIFNNSAYTIWIGSAAATTTLSTIGMPILSSKTYTMDGQWNGTLSALADSSAGGSVNVRVIKYLRY